MEWKLRILCTKLLPWDLAGLNLPEKMSWFKHILFRRKGLGAAYNATMPSPENENEKMSSHKCGFGCMTY